MSRLIELRARNGSVRAHAEVDDEDFDYLNQWRWHLNRGYAVRNYSRAGKFKTVRMARVVLGLSEADKREADHIDLDRLNNRRSNLRPLASSENKQNTVVRTGSASKFRGVSKLGRGWVAKVRVQRKPVYLGYYATEHAAAQAALNGRKAFLPFATN
jgi:hypothetical protein